jgi:integrase
MPRYAPTRLTDGFVKSLSFDGTGFIVRDTKLTGLMVAVNKACKTYKVQRDLWRGQRGRRQLVKTVRHTLGSTDELTLDQARLKAEDVIRKIKLGVDPNAQAPEPSSDGWTVADMFTEYASDLRKRQCSDRTIEGLLASLDCYLPDWKKIPLKNVSRSMVRARHQDLSEKRGKVVANHAMRHFRAAYNLALRVVDDPDLLPANPVVAVTFNKERRKGAVILPVDLPDWWAKIEVLPNPLRRTMHELGLYSGLRPGTLVGLRREWINLGERAITIPKMKSGRLFDLPLSAHMVDIVQRALQLSDMLFPKAPWLFPTRATKDNPVRGIRRGQVIATQVWREKTLPSGTGHILRHTYRTIAQRITLDKIEARLLLDHSVPGIDGVYIHETALFDRLLVAQERMSVAISDLRRNTRRQNASAEIQTAAEMGTP